MGLEISIEELGQGGMKAVGARQAVIVVKVLVNTSEDDGQRSKQYLRSWSDENSSGSI